MNVLFICSRNNWRSPTAAAIYQNKQGLNVKSAGTEPSAKTRASSKLILWADIIFVMEKKHKLRLLDRFSEELKGKKLVILDIEDEYAYMNPELVDMIKISVDPYLIT